MSPAAEARCGICSGCSATPQRPCESWVRSAVAKLERELRANGPRLAKLLATRPPDTELKIQPREKPAPPQWFGTVTFRNGRRWFAPIIVKVEATTHNAAVTRALRDGKRRLEKGTRVGGIIIRLDRVIAPRADAHGQAD